jgi:adenylate cyclase
MPGIQRVKHIGDAIMCCCGLYGEKDHALSLIKYGVAIIEVARSYSAVVRKSIQLRVGINTGPIVAGVIGSKAPVLDLFGDAVVCEQFNTIRTILCFSFPNDYDA